LALTATAALLWSSLTVGVTVKTALATSESGSETVTAEEVFAWAEFLYAFSMHPHYGDQRTLDELTLAVPPGATALRLAATKPEPSVLAEDGSFLGDGVQVYATPYKDGTASGSTLALTITPELAVERGWAWKTIRIAPDIREIKVTVTAGPPGSTTSYDATFVHAAFLGPELGILRLARWSMAMSLGALLLVAVSVAAPAISQSWPINRFPDVTAWDSVTIAVLGIMLLFTAALIYSGLHISVWRHDSMYYLVQSNYLDKFREEGRWLNLALFPVLKAMPGSVAWLGGLLLFGYFAYVCAVEVSDDRLYSTIVALLLVQSVPLYLVSTWPETIFPAYVILALAALTHRKLPLPVFYVLFGVLSLGTVSQYYYLLPLLHLGRIAKEGRHAFRTLFSVLVWWAVGFIVGFGVVLCLKYLIFGTAWIDIGVWRKPHYVASTSDLYANVQSLWYVFTERHLQAVFQNLGVVGLMVLALAVRFRTATLPYLAAALIISLAIVAAHYAITIPIGIRIEMRTIIATFVGVLAFVFLSQRLDSARRMVLALCALGVFLQYWVINYRNVDWFRTVSTTFYNELLRASPLPPPLYQGLIVEGLGARALEDRIRQSERLRPQYTEPLSVLIFSEMAGDWRWAAAAKEAGFRHVVFCESAADGRCASYLQSFTPEPCEAQKGLYCILGVTKDKYLVIRFNKRAV
jgi:hypothetical protein